LNIIYCYGSEGVINAYKKQPELLLKNVIGDILSLGDDCFLD